MVKTIQNLESDKEKLMCKVDKVVKKHCTELPYLIDLNNDLLIVKFKTRRLDPELAQKINKDLEIDGVLVPKQGYYGFQLVYGGQDL